MKPPVLHDGRPALWATGAIFAVSGVATMLLDNPLVPVTHVFGLVPLGFGGAVGAALLRQRFGPRALLAWIVLMAVYAWQVFAAQTSAGLILLVAGIHNLACGILQTVATMEG